MVERAMWREAGEAGLLCLGLPRVYGGGGGDFRHETVLNEQLARRGRGGFAVALHNTIVAPYVFRYGSEEQRARWLPMMASGAFVTARDRDDRVRDRFGPAGRPHGRARRRATTMF